MYLKIVIQKMLKLPYVAAPQIYIGSQNKSCPRNQRGTPING